ncbi:MAG: hypothetical protein JNK82_04455, partial [Myxococcaceae bacterium]|nr:hypothetical protein [Myxococcaceae bacterium]
AVGTGAETVQFDNTTAAVRTVFVVLDALRPLAAGETVDVAFTLGAIPAMLPGDVCGNVGPAITATTTLASESLMGYVSDYSGFSGGCAFGSGPDRVYQITIPSMNRVTAVVTPTPTASDYALNFVDQPATNCSNAGPCISNADLGGSGPETLFLDNTTAAPRTVYLVVDRFGAPTAGETYSLGITIGAIPAAPPGETCTNAVPITSSGTIMNETTVGYANDISISTGAATCTTFSAGTNTGGDKVYSVTIPNGQTLTAAVTPAIGFDPAIYIIPGGTCMATYAMCLDGDDTEGAGTAMNPGTETATYQNTTGAARQVYVVVDRYTAGAGGSYSLTINIQ